MWSRINATTAAPSARSRRQSQEPTNPFAPVTRTRLSRQNDLPILPPLSLGHTPEKSGAEDEDPPVHPLVGDRFFPEPRHPLPFPDYDLAELGWGFHHRHRADRPLPLVEGEECLYVDVGHTVAVGHHECPAVALAGGGVDPP